MTVATLVATSGCGYLGAWRNTGCWRSFGDAYDGGVTCDGGMCGAGVYGDGLAEGGYGEDIYGEGVYGNAQYPVYMPGEGTVIGPQILAPGETIPAPTGEPLPEPAPM